MPYALHKNRCPESFIRGERGNVPENVTSTIFHTTDARNTMKFTEFRGILRTKRRAEGRGGEGVGVRRWKFWFGGAPPAAKERYTESEIRENMPRKAAGGTLNRVGAAVLHGKSKT